MATETIREFLVALGYKQDEAALRKFEEGINKATKAVFTLAAAVEGTATLVAAGVARFASNLEALYFASLRVGSSATNIKAFDKAAQNFGATAGEAQESIEALAHALRTNPGNLAFLTGLGVQIKRARDGTVDTVDVMRQLSTILSRQPFYVANQYAQLLGITEKTLLAMRSGHFLDELRKQQELLRRNGFDKASEDAHRFMVDLRNFITQLQVFGAKVEDVLAKRLGLNLEKLGAWLEKNGDWLANRVIDVLSQLLDIAQKVANAFIWVFEKLKALDEATGGWSTKLIALAALLKVSGAGSIIVGVYALGGAFVALAANIGPAVIAAAAITAALTAAYAIYKAWKGEDASNWISNLANRLVPGGKAGKETLGGWLYELMHRGQSALRYFQDRGWSSAQAAGIVANLQAESGLRAGATGDRGQAFGLAQWHPDRQLDFKRLFGHDIRDSTFEEQLAFVNAELRNRSEYGGALLAASKTADQAARVVSRYYERPADALGEADRRAGIAAQISQKTDIHVYGSGDPASTATKVTEAQRRTNAELARNVAAATN